MGIDSEFDRAGAEPMQPTPQQISALLTHMRVT